MRTGLDRRTGKRLTGWAHCVQSIGVVLTTRLATRVMLRAFGSRLKDLQDANGNRDVLAQVYAAVADALIQWEPGFRLRTMLLDRAGPDGVYRFIIEGDFYPLGHLGDYSIVETRAGVLGLTRDGRLDTARAA